MRISVLCGIVGFIQVSLMHSTLVLNIEDFEKHHGVIVNAYDSQSKSTRYSYLILQEGMKELKFVGDGRKTAELNALKGMNATVWSQDQFTLVVSQNIARQVKVGDHLVLDYKNEVRPMLLEQKKSNSYLIDYIVPLFLLVGGFFQLWNLTSRKEGS